MEKVAKTKKGAYDIFLNILAIILLLDMVLAIGYETKIIPQDFLVAHHEIQPTLNENNTQPQRNVESNSDNSSDIINEKIINRQFNCSYIIKWILFRKVM